MNIHTGEIQLAPYKEKYKEVIQTFTLPSEQVQFTSDPTELLKKAKNDCWQIVKNFVKIDQNFDCHCESSSQISLS